MLGLLGSTAPSGKRGPIGILETEALIPNR